MKHLLIIPATALLAACLSVQASAQIACNNSSGDCSGKNVGESCGTGKTCVEVGQPQARSQQVDPGGDLVVSTTCACQSSASVPAVSSLGLAALLPLLALVGAVFIRRRRTGPA